MPLGSKLGEENTDRKISKGESINKDYLTTKKANYVYRKVDLGSLINKNTMRQEVGQDIELGKMDNASGEEIPYKELIVNNMGKIETMLSQREQWSILSNVIIMYNAINTHRTFIPCLLNP